MKTIAMFLLCATILIAQEEMKKQIQMPSIFSDNMVIQQETDAAVWGKAVEGTKIKISASWGSSAQAIADKDGNWITKINTPKFGGPYELKVEDGYSKIVFKNVMIGEVWLCSGQSNMEMPLAGWPPRDTIQNSSIEIKNADYPQIRLFTVTRAYAAEPQFDCLGKWSECNPQTIEQFSATAFFFGKKLHKELNVPIGLIHSSWGGTPVESWISKENLIKFEKYRDTYKRIEASKEQIVLLNNWLNKHTIINVNEKPESERWKNLNFNDEECSSINYDDAAWYDINLPQLWESTEIGAFDGVIWFRKKIEIPEKWINKNLVLELGPIDDMDITFVNGNKVGAYEATGYYQIDRVYEIPSDFVTGKSLSIAVRVLDNQGGGGLWGTKEKLSIGLKDGSEKINLAGIWKYLPVAEFVGGKLFVFGSENNEYKNRPPLDEKISDHTISALYNGMIAPLIPYNLRGAIWYQGESNTGNPEEYKTLFPLMIDNWRRDFGNEFSFYFTQIAPYNYGADTKSQFLREAQLLSLSVPKTGMIVTMDIGNPENIHPSNKKDVGDRLAFWALAKDYGKKVDYSGPIYKSMKVEDGKAILTFDYDEGLSINTREGKNNFKVAGSDMVFYDADVEVKGDKLIVSSDKIKEPFSVRYCWSNTEEGTLFNKAGLPASSFRTDNLKE